MIIGFKSIESCKLHQKSKASRGLHHKVLHQQVSRMFLLLKVLHHPSYMRIVVHQESISTEAF